jgi:hypothetical protein
VTQTLPSWLPAVIAGGLYAAVGWVVVGVASAGLDWLWPQDGQEGAQAGAGGPGAPSWESRDAGPAPKPAGGHTAIRKDRSKA